MHDESVPTRQHILSQIQDNQAPLKTLGLRRLGLFGSFVRNDARLDSDVDILVESMWATVATRVGS
jgi:predicted nucleotidyltransferase